jgi:hypothetical protein
MTRFAGPVAESLRLPRATGREFSNASFHTSQSFRSSRFTDYRPRLRSGLGAEARDPFRNIAKDPTRQEALRRKVFVVATPGEIEFDGLLDKVLGISQEAWVKARSQQQASS